VSGDRRRLIALGGIAAVLLLAALVLPRVLAGGGGTDTTDATAASSPTTAGPGPDAVPFEGAGPEGPAPGAAPGARGLDPTASEVFSTKNPFTPLVDVTEDTAAEEGGTSGDTEDQGGTTDDTPDDATGTTSTTTPPLPDEPSDVPPDDAGSGAGGSRTSSSITLVDVYPGADGSPVASVEVGDQLHTVAAGEAFASGRYTVVSLSDTAGSGTFRDETGEFTLLEGEAQLK